MAVYFAYSLRGNLMKIGHSKDPYSRMSSVHCMTGIRAVVVCTIPGARPEEREMHERFASEAIGYEWFHLRGALLTYLSTQSGAIEKLMALKAHTKATEFSDKEVRQVVYWRGLRKNKRGERAFPGETPLVRKDLFRRLSPKPDMKCKMCRGERSVGGHLDDGDWIKHPCPDCTFVE